MSVKLADLHVCHLVGNNKGAGESLVPVEGAAPCRVACTWHGGVTRWPSYVRACQPHSYIVLTPKLFVPPVHVLEGAFRVAVNHLREQVRCYSCGMFPCPSFSFGNLCVSMVFLRSCTLYQVLIQNETRFVHKISMTWFFVKKISRYYCTAHFLWRLVFMIHVTVKWSKLSDDQTMCVRSNNVFKAASVLFKAVSSAPMVFSRTFLDMFASTVVTVAWSLSTRSLIILGGNV